VSCNSLAPSHNFRLPSHELLEMCMIYYSAPKCDVTAGMIIGSLTRLEPGSCVTYSQTSELSSTCFQNRDVEPVDNSSYGPLVQRMQQIGSRNTRPPTRLTQKIFTSYLILA
jgi:hypothetical protein